MNKHTKHLVILLLSFMLMAVVSSVYAQPDDSGITVLDASYSADKPFLSGDGRYIFYSEMKMDTETSKLIKTVHVYDRQLGQFENLNLDFAGGRRLTAVQISPDGRFLVIAATSSYSDYYLYDRTTHSAERLPFGVEVAYQSFPQFSADNRFLAFSSIDLLTDHTLPQCSGAETYNCHQVYVYDRQSETITLVSTNALGTDGYIQSLNPAISADGRYVAFLSATTSTWNAFMYDRQTESTIQIPINDVNPALHWSIGQPFISANGSQFVFPAGRFNGQTAEYALYQYDATSGILTPVPYNGRSAVDVSISADLRFIAYRDIPPITGPCGPCTQYLAVYDRQTGTETRVPNVSPHPHGHQFTISADGSTLVNVEAGRDCETCQYKAHIIIADLPLGTPISSPLLTTPANQFGAEGDMVSLWLNPFDLNAWGQLTYSAAGLPPGLSISADGLISGTIADDAKAGSPYTVTVTAGNALAQSDSVSFTWTLDDRLERLYPADGNTITTASEWPRFKWNAKPGAEWYYIVVLDTQQNFVYYEWFDAEYLCVQGVCTLPKDLWFSNGDYGWWIATFENGQQSIYNQATFTVNVIEPVIISPETPYITPSFMNAGDSQVTLSWQQDNNAVWYEVYVEDAGKTFVYNQWYDGRDICTEGMCSVGLDIPAGAYSWWLRAWGPGGMSEWNIDANATFTVNP